MASKEELFATGEKVIWDKLPPEATFEDLRLLKQHKINWGDGPFTIMHVRNAPGGGRPHPQTLAVLLDVEQQAILPFSGYWFTHFRPH